MVGIMNFHSGILGVLVTAATLAGVAPGIVRAERVALVIGNGAYERLPLRNPVNDARSVASALRDLGFVVVQKENATYPQMLEGMREFLDRARTSDVRLIYYAGHGTQHAGRNFLIPVDAVLRSEDELPQKAANVTDLIDRLARHKSGVNVVILDACRDAPYPLLARTRNPHVVRTLPAGFAPPAQPAQGTFVAYSTAPGSVALDGPGTNSAYTRHLVERIREPGVPIEHVFKRVRDGVIRDTAQKQVPWEMSSLVGEFCLRTGPGGACPSVAPIAVR